MASVTIKLTDEQLKELHSIECELWERGENSAVLSQVSFHHGGLLHCTVIDGEKARAIQAVMGVNEARQMRRAFEFSNEVDKLRAELAAEREFLDNAHRGLIDAFIADDRDSIDDILQLITRHLAELA